MKLPSGEKYVIGYDLNDAYVQISYANMDTGKVDTISSVAGTEIFTIPAVLVKGTEENRWFYGREAEKAEREDRGIRVDHLLSRAIDGEMVQITGESYDPVALLAIFVKKSFGLLAQLAAPDRTVAIMFTCESLDQRVKEVLGKVVQSMRLKADRVFYQSYQESFYQYMLYQPGELMRQQSLLLSYRGNKMQVYRMLRNHRTRPEVIYVEEAAYNFTSYDPMPEGEEERSGKCSRLDGEFLELVTELCENQVISSVYLIGESFSREWMKDSLRYLCRGRRVFQGNNLYSKGACYGLLQKLKEEKRDKSTVFLGKDKLKVNVGMRINRRGKTSYCALLNAGLGWYDAETTLECYLQEGNTLEFLLTSLVAGEESLVSMRLDGLPEGICRLKVSLFMKDEEHLAIEIEDLGFGHFREATHRVWAEEIRLQS